MVNVQYFAEALKLKVQYFGHLIRRADSLEKTLMLGKIEDEMSTEDEMIGWHHQLNPSSKHLDCSCSLY